MDERNSRIESLSRDSHQKIPCPYLLTFLKRLGFIVVILLLLIFERSDSIAQSNQRALTLDYCLEKARLYYPLNGQQALISQTLLIQLKNIERTFWPQLNTNGQASYQSDVTRIPFAAPAGIEPLSKDQYRLQGEASQSLSDLVNLKNQKNMARQNALIESGKLEIELYKIQEKLIQLFFGILMADAQIKLTELLQQDINTALEKLTAAASNGIVAPLQLELLQAERIKLDQRLIEIFSLKNNLREMLGQWIHESLDSTIIFQQPPSPMIRAQLNRPEIRLIDLQSDLTQLQFAQVKWRTKPKVFLFLQGGYGRPGLNMLNNSFDWYGLGGLKLQWNLSTFYTLKKEQQLLTLQKEGLHLQKEVFNFNVDLILSQQNADIKKWQTLIQSDLDLITLRSKISKTMQVQLEQGTITAHDFIIQLNAEDQARQNKSIHELQLLLSQYQMKNVYGQ